MEYEKQVHNNFPWKVVYISSKITRLIKASITSSHHMEIKLIFILISITSRKETGYKSGNICVYLINKKLIDWMVASVLGHHGQNSTLTRYWTLSLNGLWLYILRHFCCQTKKYVNYFNENLHDLCCSCQYLTITAI